MPNALLIGCLVLSLGPGTEALPDAREVLDVVADPDEPRFSYGTIGARSRSSFGGHLGLVGFRPNGHRVILALSPLLELANITDQPISWQTFRANVGLNVLWSPRSRAAESSSCKRASSTRVITSPTSRPTGPHSSPTPQSRWTTGTSPRLSEMKWENAGIEE